MARHIFHLCLLFFIFSLFIQHTRSDVAYPLSTSLRWIVDRDGQRVKLTCVDWRSHLEPVVAEGLSKQPADSIAKKIVAMGFNCVRLTWPLDLATNDTLAHSITVRRSFQSLGLNDDIVGIQKNNPYITDLSLLEAFKAVVSTLGSNGLMVILENDHTKPGLCCAPNEEDGFFGDKNFDPKAWVIGLNKMATIFNSVPNVVGMSLRNELSGPRQNVDEWFRWMVQGAEVVSWGNPNVLIILSGLHKGEDLSFLQNRRVSVSFEDKLVFKLHWYSYSDALHWDTLNHNDVCGQFQADVRQKAGFLLDKGFPLFISEFGINENKSNVLDDRYISCFLNWAAENDLDWSLYTLTGSYYLRQGKVGFDERYGLFASDWINVRNPRFLQRLSLIQSPLRGPGPEIDMYKLIFHPLTGLCLVQKSPNDPSLTLGQCNQTEKWSYDDNNLRIQGQSFCLQAHGAGQPVKLGMDCSIPGSKWQPISNSTMHLASSTSINGTYLCLDVDSNNNVVANVCKCLSEDSKCDPTSQWFKVIKAKKKTASPRDRLAT